MELQSRNTVSFPSPFRRQYLFSYRDEQKIPCYQSCQVFPSALVAILLCLCTVLVFLRFGGHDRLSQHEDEMVQPSLSCSMCCSIVLRPSYQTKQIEANFIYGRVKLFQDKFIRKEGEESISPSPGWLGDGKESGFLFAIS